MSADDHNVAHPVPGDPGGPDDAAGAAGGPLDAAGARSARPITPRGPWWRDARRLKRIGAGVGIAVSVLAIAGMAYGVVVLFGPRFGLRGARPTSEPSSPPTVSAPAAPTTPAPVPSVPGSVAATPSAPATLGVARVTVVPYRFAGAIWVSDGSGGNVQRIVSSATGEFAISPDGATLAVIDATTKTLTLVDVSTRRAIDVGPAEVEPPEWSADSSAVAYAVLPAGSHDTVIRVATRDGSGSRTLGAGAMPTFAPGGEVVAVSAARTGGVPLVVYAARGSRLIGSGIVANAAGAGTETVAFCDVGDPVRGTPARLGVIGLDGAGQRVVVPRPAASAGAFFGEARVTLDGTRIVYTETGDDGYSRVYVIPVRGGKSRLLSGRSDGYPVCFSADGAELFYVSGNAIQGETTRLEAVRLDGTHRRVVIDGAGT